MMLDPPAYLTSLQSNVRLRLLPWDGLVRSGHLTEEHRATIRIGEDAVKRKALRDGDLDRFCKLFVGDAGKPGVVETAGNLKNKDLVQNALVLLSDLLDSFPALAKALFKTGAPYQSLVPLLAQEDPIPLFASVALVSLMANSKDLSEVAIKRALPPLLSHLSSLTKNPDPSLQDIGVQEYSMLLYSKENREVFWNQRSETVEPLIKILRSAAGVSNGDSSASLWNGATGTARSNGFEGSMGVGVGLQLLYHVLLVMWQMSFEAKTVGYELNEEYDIILLYTQLLRLSQKEKTTRLLLSTLFNLLSAHEDTLLPTAVLARMPALLQNLAGRQLTDQDLLEDLEKLRDLLDEYTKTKTTFDEYVGEVRSGHLRWSPPHRNTVFWAENARKILEHENGELVRRLADIMKKPWDNDKAVLAIACNDVGSLVREVPEKRSQLEKLGLKTRIMELMGEADENVRWESLRALGGWLKYSFESK